ncbi:MAG: PhnE/PtxC family ABC transporter permease, partial [Ferrovibrio sp.]
MSATAAIRELPIHPPKAGAKHSLGKLLLYGLIAAMLVWSWQGAEIAPLKLISDAGNMVTFLGDFFPPDFTDWRLYLSELIITLHIAVWGTVLAVVCAVPLSLLAAANIAP